MHCTANPVTTTRIPYQYEAACPTLGNYQHINFPPKNDLVYTNVIST